MARVQIPLELTFSLDFESLRNQFIQNILYIFPVLPIVKFKIVQDNEEIWDLGTKLFFSRYRVALSLPPSSCQPVAGLVRHDKRCEDLTKTARVRFSKAAQCWPEISRTV